MQTISQTITKHRYTQLDSLRGVAALTVFLCHYVGVLFSAPTLNRWGATPVGILFNGYAAVMFFFALSGFVLSLSFINTREPLNITSFYIKRIFRIYPALIIAIALSVVLKVSFYDNGAMAASHIWYKSYWAWNWSNQNIKQVLKSFLLLAPNFNPGLIDPPIWSLVIEVQMSILLPFFIRIVSLNSAVLNILFFFVVICLTYDSTSWPIGVFYLGVLLAKYKNKLLLQIERLNSITFITIIIFALLLYNINFGFLNVYRYLSPAKQHITIYFIAAAACTIILVVIANEKATRFFEHPILKFTGRISYSFYLIHMPMLITMASIFTCKFPFSPGYIFLTSFIATITVSYLTYLFVETPFKKLAKTVTTNLKGINI